MTVAKACVGQRDLRLVTLAVGPLDRLVDLCNGYCICLFAFISRVRASRRVAETVARDVK